MEQTTWWQVSAVIIGALGGFEFIKWLFTRKRTARTDEFKLLRETNEFLQKQLQAKEERFAEQTQLVRKQNTEILEMTTKMAEMEIRHEQEKAELKIELVKVRCNDEDCPFRRPPNSHTPPKPGMTKEQYHSQKLLPQ